MEAVVSGYRAQSRVRGGVILVALRSKDSAHGVSMARLAGRHLHLSPGEAPGVLGLDVAGDEGSFPLASDSDPMAAGVRQGVRLSLEPNKLGKPHCCE